MAIAYLIDIKAGLILFWLYWLLSRVAYRALIRMSKDNVCISTDQAIKAKAFAGDFHWREIAGTLVCINGERLNKSSL